MENLAPAGNWDALRSAVAAGADAVYLGYAAYSARAGAGNFDEQQLRDAVRFAHLHHVRVHVTVNTLIKDGEMAGVVDVLRLLSEIRVDAVLVQDLGVLRMARRCFPDLPIHASTQMAIHNATGVRFCRNQGMTRAVLARECSAAEIALAAKEGIEIEVFGHGAQCVAVSGECLFSSVVGGRSGNRGRCAQPCRLLYTYRGKTAAWLSPRDVCMRDDLPELNKAGVASIKLEGRLKRPEYVATIANSYRNAIDAMDNGHFRKADEAEMTGLRQIFSRGGFMRGYAMGAEDAGVIDPARVSHGGVKIGRVEFAAGNMARVRLERSLDDGDGLQIRTAQGDAELIYAGHDTEAGQIAVVRLRSDIRTKAGDEVYRLTSEKQLQWARSLAIPAIPADMALIAYPGKPLALTMTDGENSVTVTGDTVAPAQSRAMSEEDARRSLGKLSDTPFSLRTLTVQTAGAFVPVSALNQLRREACQQLAEARIAAFTRKAGREEPADDLIYPDTPDAPSMAIVRTREQADAMQGAADLLVWYPEDFRADALESGLRDMPDGVWLQLPTVCEEKTLDALDAFVQRNAGKLGGIVLGSVGQLGRTWNVPMGAGSGIPVMNRRAAQFLLEQGCRFVTASSELSGAELRTLMQNHPPVVVPAYGREQLMLLHHCPARTYLGLTKGHAACRMCDQHSPDALAGQTLTDRRGTVYPLLRQRLPEGCLVRLMNALPTNNIRRVRQAGYAPMMVLTTENAQEAADVRAVMDGAMRELEGTSNHWNRPVE
ncbi:MAG: U32 family peptidase [Clostridiales bacterium]|nr:U32 family peptidase [Clostridiales bacterium]